MSPADEASLALRRLLRNVGEDRTAFEERHEEIRRYAGAGGEPSSERKSALAMALHHYYTAFERILERTMRQLEGSLPDGADWHDTLMREASRELENVRPALVSEAALDDWVELRRFRHFVRHAYGATLEWDRLRELAEVVERLHPRAIGDLDGLRAFLEETIEALENGPFGE